MAPHLHHSISVTCRPSVTAIALHPFVMRGGDPGASSPRSGDGVGHRLADLCLWAETPVLAQSLKLNLSTDGVAVALK